MTHELEKNPHFSQMVEEIVKDPSLLARVEAGDIEAVREASERAKEHFLLLSLGVLYSEKAHEALISGLCEQIYNQIHAENRRR